MEPTQADGSKWPEGATVMYKHFDHGTSQELIGKKSQILRLDKHGNPELKWPGRNYTSRHGWKNLELVALPDKPRVSVGDTVLVIVSGRKGWVGTLQTVGKVTSRGDVYFDGSIYDRTSFLAIGDRVRHSSDNEIGVITSFDGVPDGIKVKYPSEKSPLNSIIECLELVLDEKEEATPDKPECFGTGEQPCSGLNYGCGVEEECKQYEPIQEDTMEKTREQRAKDIDKSITEIEERMEAEHNERMEAIERDSEKIAMLKIDAKVLRDHKTDHAAQVADIMLVKDCSPEQAEAILRLDDAGIEV